MEEHPKGTRSVIVGMGEVGSALYEVIKDFHTVYTKDIHEWPDGTAPQQIGMLHVCLNYTPRWMDIVLKYAEQLRPDVINVQTTVPPGTTRALSDKLECVPCAHSTTRGLHPNLTRSMQTFVKHVGGVDPTAARLVAEYFERAAVRCVLHGTPETTELAHILSNSLYGVNIMFADEMARLCRHYGVDYYEAVTMYTDSANEGYRMLGHGRSKMRMQLTPPHGRIGGHCVVYGANLIPEEQRGPIMDQLAKFNKK